MKKTNPGSITQKNFIKLKKNEILLLSGMTLFVLITIALMMSSNLMAGPVAKPTPEVSATETTTEAVTVEKINKTITPEEAKTLLEADQKRATETKTPPEVYLIDVRTPEEFSEGRIPNSLNIPLDKLESIQMLVPYADRSIIVYCRSGNRSAQAAALLGTYGYNTVYDLGGIVNWPYETTK